jgi:hypothetical protein
MIRTVIPAHFDGDRIQLDEPVDLQPDMRLFVTIVSKDDEEREEWHRFSALQLARAYSDDEPEYGPESIIEVNPDYAGR